ALLGKATLKEAVAFLRKGQRLHPQDYWINVNLANSLMQMGPQLREEAIRHYTAAVALRPKTALSHFNLGNALEGRGQLDEAVACYRKSLELNPKQAAVYNRLGTALTRLGRKDEATAAFQEVARQSAAQAVAAWREAVRSRPNDPLAHFSLGTVLGKQGK